MEEQFGKGNTSTPVERAKPTIVEIDGKSVLTGGRWYTSAMADFVIAKYQNKWVKVGELARVACGANTIPNKKRVRAQLSSLFMELRERGHLLAIEYNGQYSAASAVKIADLTSSADRQLVEEKLEWMRKRMELTEEQYVKSHDLLNAKLN